MPLRSFGSGFELMFTPRAYIPFVIGSLALSIMGNAAFALLAEWLGKRWATYLGMLFGFALVLVFAAGALSRLFNRRSAPGTLVNKNSPGHRKGLILLVSSETTARKAIDWHRPMLERCWLFHSDEERSRSAAKLLEQELNSSGKQAELRHIDDVYEPLEFKRKVDAIYDTLPQGWKQADIILDFTGMTAVASVGSVLACLNEDRPIQYTPGRYNNELKALEALNPVEMELHWGLLGPAPAEGAPPGGASAPANGSVGATGGTYGRTKHPAKARRK